MKNLKGYQIKSVLSATLERLFKSYNVFNNVDKIEINVSQWEEQTMGVKHERRGDTMNVDLVIPSVDDNAIVTQEQLNHLVALVFHEVGHVLYTNGYDWDNAVYSFKNEYPNHSKFFHGIINGLEDVRQEEKLIKKTSNNAKGLLSKLLNDMIAKSNGLPQPDDFKNIPFVLAVEGRRLNNYQVNYEFDWSKCVWAAELQVALKRLKSAKNTLQITKISFDLFESLKKYMRSDKLPQPNESINDQGSQDSEESESGKSGESGESGESGKSGESGNESQGDFQNSGSDPQESGESGESGESDEYDTSENLADDCTIAISSDYINPEPSVNDDLPRLDSDVFGSLKRSETELEVENKDDGCRRTQRVVKVDSDQLIEMEIL